MLWRVEVKSGVYAFDDWEKTAEFIWKETKYNKPAYVDEVHTGRTIVFEGKRRSRGAINRLIRRGAVGLESL